LSELPDPLKVKLRMLGEMSGRFLGPDFVHEVMARFVIIHVPSVKLALQERIGYLLMDSAINLF
jgi:hypothetical protein